MGSFFQIFPNRRISRGLSLCKFLDRHYFARMADRYSFSLTTFSPSGKLVQIEYALNAVAAGSTSLGIKATNGVVVATEKKVSSPLVDETMVKKIAEIDKHLGMVYSGMGPDSRVLITKARKIAQKYMLTYGEPIPANQLVREVASVMQEFTQSGGVRPFGVSLLILVQTTRGPCCTRWTPRGLTSRGRRVQLARTWSMPRHFW